MYRIWFWKWFIRARTRKSNFIAKKKKKLYCLLERNNRDFNKNFVGHLGESTLSDIATSFLFWLLFVWHNLILLHPFTSWNLTCFCTSTIYQICIFLSIRKFKFIFIFTHSFVLMAETHRLRQTQKQRERERKKDRIRQRATIHWLTPKMARAKSGSNSGAQNAFLLSCLGKGLN